MATYVISARPDNAAWIDFDDDFDSGRIEKWADYSDLDEAAALIWIEDDDTAMYRALSEHFNVESPKIGLYLGQAGYTEVADPASRPVDVDREVKHPESVDEINRYHPDCAVAYCEQCRDAYMLSEIQDSLSWDEGVFALCPNCGAEMNLGEHFDACTPAVVF